MQKSRSHAFSSPLKYQYSGLLTNPSVGCLLCFSDICAKLSDGFWVILFLLGELHRHAWVGNDAGSSSPIAPTSSRSLRFLLRSAWSCPSLASRAVCGAGVRGWRPGTAAARPHEPIAPGQHLGRQRLRQKLLFQHWLLQVLPGQTLPEI